MTMKSNNNVRKSFRDYKNEYNEVLIRQKRLTNEIHQRLLELSTANPQVIITEIGDVQIKAKSIADKNYIKTIDIPTSILYIQRIEEWLAKQNPVQQKKIEFPS